MLWMLLVVGCAGSRSAPAPVAGDSRGFVPDLRGRSVMLLPVQRISGVSADIDREIEFVLRERGGGVDWSFTGDVDDALERSPGVQASTRGLPVSPFLQAEVDRIGDPLYGQLRRMAALVNAEVAVLPVQARYAAVGSAGEMGIELSVAIVDVRTGRIFWYGVMGGRPGAADDFATVASAAEAMADRVLWSIR